MTKKTKNLPIPESFKSLSALLLHAFGDVLPSGAETLLDLVTDDIIFEFPFPMPNGVRRIKGKAALRDYLPKVGAALSIETLSLKRSFLSEDRTIAVVEFNCEGCSKTTDARYDQDYVSVLDLRDGLISRYRDYWNPLIALSALGNHELAYAAQTELSAAMSVVTSSPRPQP